MSPKLQIQQHRESLLLFQYPSLLTKNNLLLLAKLSIVRERLNKRLQVQVKKKNHRKIKKMSIVIFLSESVGVKIETPF